LRLNVWRSIVIFWQAIYTMALLFRNRVWHVAGSIAGFGAIVLLALPPVATQAHSPSASLSDDAAADIARLESYLVQVNGRKSSPASLRDNDAEVADDLARLENYLANVNGGKGRSSKLAQGNNDDLLTQPSTPAPAPSGSSKPSSDDLLAPAPSGSDLLTPAPTGGDLLTPAPSGGDLLAPAPSSGDLLTPGGNAPADVLKVAPSATNEKESEEAKKKQAADEARRKAADAEHEKLFLETKYPSATTCGVCHVKQFEEWSVSQHAYAQLSVVFGTMQTKININSGGTNGDFCIRCHTPLGMNLNESVYISNEKRTPASREGITCVACHRVNQAYGRISARMATVEGDIYSPVYGPKGGAELKRVLSKPGEYRVTTSKDQPGRAIHTRVKQAFFLTKPQFCGTCHDVALLNGFRLEEAYTEFKASPAVKKNGTTCQDCHMGRVQGVPSGYDYGPAAIVGGVPTRDRKLANHTFAGPDYSVIHPGLFPLNADAQKFKTIAEWLQFDYKAGWGTDKFENSVSKDYKFPPAWESRDERYDAQAILKTQFERLAKARQMRLQVLRNGVHLSDKINIIKSDASGLQFSIDVINATTGHAVPTGFDAERLFFLEVTVTDSHGKKVYVSGDRDPNGDVRDSHSVYVHNGERERDEDLFSLQSVFLVRMLRGGEREQVLPTNLSADVLPFVRPETRATTLVGHPLSARKFKQTIEPLGRRTATYAVPADKLRSGERYKITIRFIAQMIPVNLIDTIQDAGFDYGMSPAEIARRVVSGSVALWTRRAEVTLP
jgi:Cytochrome c554 and c-prime